MLSNWNKIIWGVLCVSGLAVLLSLTLPTVFWRGSPSQFSQEKAQRLLNCIAHAEFMKVRLIADNVEWSHKGERLFDNAIALLKEAIARGPQARVPGSAESELTLFDDSGTKCLVMGLGASFVDFDGWRLKLSGDGIQYPFSQAYTQRTYCYPSGKRLAEGIHDKGRKDGEWNYYYESGEQLSSGTYDHGMRIGKWIMWDRDGKVIQEETYKHGIVVERRGTVHIAWPIWLSWR